MVDYPEILLKVRIILVFYVKSQSLFQSLINFKLISTHVFKFKMFYMIFKILNSGLNNR